LADLLPELKTTSGPKSFSFAHFCRIYLVVCRRLPLLYAAVQYPAEAVNYTVLTGFVLTGFAQTGRVCPDNGVRLYS